jgi:acetyl-CoA synthetase
LVAESAVVSKPHEIKGESVFAYVVLNGARPTGDAAKSLITELRNWVGEQLSPIAKPDEIRLTDNLPKTRSGKIMRRILRKIGENDLSNLGDTSTLADPSVVDNLVANRPQLVGA